MNFRPSALLAIVENGVLGTGGAIAHGVAAGCRQVKAATRQASIEFRARKLADANVLAETINAHEEAADREEIARRCEELIAKRRAAARKPTGKATGRKAHRVVR